ncbi:MAG TPA: hypothetical protein VF226_19210 [Hyphomicrobiaceae bacterium]
MFNLDDQLEWAKIWGDMVLSCMSVATQCTTTMLAPWQQIDALFSSAKPGEPSSSPGQALASWSNMLAPSAWHRPPERSPFEPSWLGLAWVLPLAVPGLALAPQSAIGPLAPMQAWTKLLEASAPMAALGLPTHLLPAGPASFLRSLGWPMAGSPFAIGAAVSIFGPAPARPASVEAPQFAAYRSDSGHAVAQITFPNKVVAAVAVPESAASMIDAIFPWQRLLH